MDLQKIANVIRGLAADAVQKANSGHPGAPWVWLMWAQCFILTSSSIIRPIPSGPTVTASSFPVATRPCSFIPCCIFRAIKFP